MDVKRLGALFFFVILLMVPVNGKVDTSSWGGKPSPELNLGIAGELAAGDPIGLIGLANMGEDFGLDSNAMFRSADEWNKRAEESEELLKEILSKKDSHPDDRENAAAFAIRERELAISKYQATNDAKGSNDANIANTYVALADVYKQLGPDYDAQRYLALEKANAADPFNKNAWDQRIQILRSRNLQSEADQVKGEMDQAYGEAALNAALPLSPLAGIAGLCVVIFLSGRNRAKKR
ncbi:MAG: hypothetical protein LUQ54_01560 [Methanoregula sp.]|nr:hypothetical protein [Methanoregula sp.]